MSTVASDTLAKAGEVGVVNCLRIPLPRARAEVEATMGRKVERLERRRGRIGFIFIDLFSKRDREREKNVVKIVTSGQIV